MMRISTRQLVAAGLVILCSARISATELWDRAVDIYDEYSTLVPGRVSVRFDQYNGRGKLVSTETSAYRLAYGPSGEIQSDLTYASRDGEDITEERRGGAGAPFGGGEESNNNSPFSGLQKSPFDPAEQDRVTVTDTGRSEYVEGVRTRVHLFNLSTGGDNRTTGTVWIAEDTGAPVRLTAGIEPLPGYIDVFRMDQVYATDAEGRWYLARMQFVGEGNILFVRRRIESEFLFSDYIPVPAQALN